MNIEELFNRNNIIDLSFFNFRNAITAAYFADSQLRILKVNTNFRSFFPILGNVSNAYFPDVLEQLGVEEKHIRSFADDLKTNGHVLIPHIELRIDNQLRVYSLLSTHTSDDSFSYLNGVQGQFVDRTAEYELRREREALLEEKIRDRELIEDKTRQLESLANRLAKYLSPQIYAAVFAGQSGAKETLARKSLTVFFSDIEGFTAISDGMEPERLADVVNTYLSEMAEIALEYGGTIDKFIGDAMLVFFGDPETEGDREDALRCARMALRMRERVAELQDLWRSKGVSKPLRVRMGINSGYCTVGNFGSDQRLEYTVLGSPVNLAARLQTVAEPDTILLSESTYLLIEDVAECVHVGEITPRGFHRPVATYRLESLGDGTTASAAGRAVTRVGKHVHVSIPDRHHIREAIQELKRIHEELQRTISAE
jgi:adenylate cyclase